MGCQECIRWLLAFNALCYRGFRRQQGLKREVRLRGKRADHGCPEGWAILAGFQSRGRCRGDQRETQGGRGHLRTNSLQVLRCWRWWRWWRRGRGGGARRVVRQLAIAILCQF